MAMIVSALEMVATLLMVAREPIFSQEMAVMTPSMVMLVMILSLEELAMTPLMLVLVKTQWMVA